LILLKYVGIHPIVIHGGGKMISAVLLKKGLPSKFVDGLRISYPETIDVIKDVLINKVGKSIVRLIQKSGGEAISLSARHRRLLRAQKVYLRKNRQKIDLGFTGQVTTVDTEEIIAASERGYIPVISSIALGRDENFYNVNADSAASAVAAALSATKMILLTDVNGVMDKHGKLVSSLDTRSVRRLIRNRTISGGMIPKVKCCLDALKASVEKTHIINGKLPHALLLEIFTDHGIGTMVSA
jgi:acetylglutamate kinase